MACLPAGSATDSDLFSLFDRQRYILEHWFRTPEGMLVIYRDNCGVGKITYTAQTRW